MEFEDIEELFPEIIEEAELSGKSIKALMNRYLQVGLKYADRTTSLQVPNEKGKLGENYIRDLIGKYIPKAHCEHVAGTGHKGDLMISLPKCNKSVLVEVKNYNTKIPKKEVSKFYRDITENSSEVCAAMMVNIGNGSITGIKNAIEIHSDTEGTPAVFVSSGNDSEIIGGLLYIEQLMMNNNSVDIDSKLWSALEHSCEGTATARTQWQNAKSGIISSLEMIDKELSRKFSNDEILLSLIKHP